MEAIEEIKANMPVESQRVLTKNAKRAVSGATGLFGGWFGGKGAETIFNYFDKDRKMNPYARDLAEGATSGLLAWSALSAIGGTMGGTLVGAEMAAGAVGYLAGDLTYKGVHKLAENIGLGEKESDLTATLSAGFVGGAASVLTSIGTAALLGSEMGSVLGLGGIVIGALGGATLGGLIAGGSYFYSHWNDWFG